MLQLSSKDAPTLWPSTQADNLLNVQDMTTLGYFWDTLKLDKVGAITQSTGHDWGSAADLALWLLQGKAHRRPASMEHVLEHRFFKPDGKLHYFESADEPMDAYVKRQAEKLTACITSGDSGAVKEMFDHGGVHLKMLDASIGGSTVTPLMRAAFVGKTATVKVLLDEIEDSWPEDVRKAYLDQRTALDFTAHMIACVCGHTDIASLLEAKGCSTYLVNSFGKTGDALLRAGTGHKHSTSQSLESYLALLDHKAIVMSCPETGTLKPDGSGPYDQHVMDKINELRSRGKLKGGFDRAGSSNMDPRDDEIWPKIFRTEGQEHLFEIDEQKRKDVIKSTYWFTGYRTAAKAQMNLECQTFDGTLDVICIKGGPITDVEHEEMDRIVEEARQDAAKNGIQTNVQVKKISYYEFLHDYDPESVLSKTEQMQEQELEPEENPRAAHSDDTVDVDKGASPTVRPVTVQLRSVCASHFPTNIAISQIHTHDASPAAKIAQLEQALIAKDQELTSVVAAEAAKEEELQQLRAQLDRLEGVPPPRAPG